MSDRVAAILSAVTAAFHLAVASRYDLFRDELYFIVCGRHPAFGYADQPPLVPLLAAAGYALGAQTWVVRLPAVFAAAALVWLVVAFVRLLGGRDGAAWMAGIVAAVTPMLLGLTATLNTTTFEPLAWTLVAYALARALVLDDRRALLWGGLVAGLEMEVKYALPLWLLALAAGLALFGPRRIFAYRELWLGLGLALVLALPSVIWQAANGFPFVELVRNAADKDLEVSPLAFAVNQLVVMDPLFAPVWLGGLVAPFTLASLRPVRFIAVAFFIAALATVAGHGKDYYLAPAYPALFAIGATALERWIGAPAVRGALVACGLAVALIAAPLALPLLSPGALVAYETAIHMRASAQETGDDGDAIPPTFADMLGWHDFVNEVAAAWGKIPARERPRTAILVDNYGEAAALDIYGPAYGLPPPLSGHNQYFFWALRGQNPVNLLRVQFHPERLAPHCLGMEMLSETVSHYARDFENGRAVVYCPHVRPPLIDAWPTLKHFI